MREVDDRSTDGSERLLSVSEYFGVAPRDQRIDEGDWLTRADSLVGYRRACAGDLVVNIMLAWKRGLGVAPMDGIVSPAYAVFRPDSRSLHPGYAGYLLRTDLYTSEFRRNSTGIMDSRLRIYPEDFLRVPVLLPPLKDQRAIAGFLDRQTDKIDALLAKKRRLVDLLHEKRIALISDAVTKGLDVHAAKRSSGSTAVGDIPEHWSLPHLGLCCLVLTDGTHAPPPRSSGTDRLLSARNLVDGDFVLREDDRIMSPEDAHLMSSSCYVRRGDVLLTIVGATTGKSAVARDIYDVAVQRSLAILRPRPSMIEAEYLHLWLQSAASQQLIRRTVEQYAAQPGIYLQDVAALPVALPPLTEQKQILTHTRAAFGGDAQLASAISTQMARVTEYRAALITAAVTGQIDVRTYRREAS